MNTSREVDSEQQDRHSVILTRLMCVIILGWYKAAVTHVGTAGVMELNHWNTAPLSWLCVVFCYHTSEECVNDQKAVNLEHD